MLSLKKRKTPIKDDETWETIALHYFLVSVFVFCGYGLYFPLFSVSVLRFNFVFLCVFFRLGMLISVRGFGFFCFLVVFFCFRFPILSYVFLFRVCSLLFLSLLLFNVVLWFFCFYRPPYIFDRPLHLSPTTGEHFKTPSKISSQRSNRSGKK